MDTLRQLMPAIAVGPVAAIAKADQLRQNVP